MSTKTLIYIITLILVQCVLLCQSRPIPDSSSEAFFDVTEYGAAGDGVIDDTKAFKDAWEATCQSGSTRPTMYVPGGKTFLLKSSVVFDGECNSNNMALLIDGTLIAPEDPSDWKCSRSKKCNPWIEISHVVGMRIHGSGTINPRGSPWWDRSLCKNKNIGCGKKPTGFTISHSNDVQLSGLTFVDSPQMHVSLERSSRVHVRNITIRAPEHSHNTDGIHIQHAEYVIIEDSTIGTGDDCISIGDGSVHVDISQIQCGPGHGISVGSLGKHGNHETVENVRVRDVTFTGTTNGARIKSWQGGSGYARNITFERITIEGSSHPIVIDQFYCDHEKCTNQSSAVEISDVSFMHFKGTSHKTMAVKLACSQTHPCRNIYMEDIDLGFTDQGKSTSSVCSNVVDSVGSSGIFPETPCLFAADNGGERKSFLHKLFGW